MVLSSPTGNRWKARTSTYENGPRLSQRSDGETLTAEQVEVEAEAEIPMAVAMPEINRPEGGLGLAQNDRDDILNWLFHVEGPGAASIMSEEILNVYILQDKDEDSRFTLQWLLQERIRRETAGHRVRKISENEADAPREAHSRVTGDSLLVLRDWSDGPSLREAALARMWEMRHGGRAALIHVPRERPMALLKELEDRLPAVRIFLLSPRRLGYDVKIPLVGLLCGGISAEDGSFDQVSGTALVNASSAFRQLYHMPENAPGLYSRVLGRHYGAAKDRSVRRTNGPESELHYHLKLLVVAHLHRDWGIPVNRIVSEGEWEGAGSGGKVVPDIQVDRVVWEIETLYGCGTDPVKKLDETVDKYGGKAPEVNIVVPNIALTLYEREIAQRLALWRAEGTSVKVWGTCLRDLTLMTFDDILAEAHRLVELGRGTEGPGRAPTP